jgi:hypothetical protein
MMVIEVSAVPDQGKPRFLFKYDKSSPVLGKCENCFNERVLKSKCPCGKANYCNPECRQADENYHIKTCAYLNRIDIDAISFT